MKTVLKHPEAKIILKQNQTKIPLEIAELNKKVEECSKFTESILSTFSEVDKDIKELNQKFQEASDNLYEFGGGLIDSAFDIADKGIKKNDETSIVAAGGAMAVGAAATLIGGAVSLVGHAYSSYKKNKAIRRRDEKMQEILKKKQDIALERYDGISNFKDSFAINLANTEKLYDHEFNKSVEINDALIHNKITVFKASFALKVKSIYLDKTLDFVLAEMNAWKQEKHDSDKEKVDFQQILQKEISTWSSRLKYQEWDTMIKDYIKKNSTTYPIAIATVFIEPALLSNYVGINLPCNNCSSAIIQTSENGIIDISNYSIAPLLNKNKYFTDCKQILQKNFKIIPLKKVPIGVDILAIAVPVLFSFGIAIIMCSLFPELLVRLLSLCVSFGICYLSMAIELPSQKAYSQYTVALTKMKEKLSSDEKKSYIQSQTINF